MCLFAARIDWRFAPVKSMENSYFRHEHVKNWLTMSLCTLHTLHENPDWETHFFSWCGIIVRSFRRQRTPSPGRTLKSPRESRSMEGFCFSIYTSTSTLRLWSYWWGFSQEQLFIPSKHSCVFQSNSLPEVYWHGLAVAAWHWTEQDLFPAAENVWHHKSRALWLCIPDSQHPKRNKIWPVLEGGGSKVFLVRHESLILWENRKMLTFVKSHSYCGWSEWFPTQPKLIHLNPICWLNSHEIFNISATSVPWSGV